MQKSLLLATALLVSVSLYAQRGRNLSIGPTVGLNVSNLYGDVTNNRAKVGLAAGAFFNYSIKTHFGVSGQVLYSQLGANFKTSASSDGIKLNYLQVPLFATYYFGTSLRPGTIRPKLFAGPHVGFLLAAKSKSGVDRKDSYNPLDLGVTLGGGLNYALENQMWLNFDLRYGLGLFDIDKDANANIHNGAFSAMVGLSFALGNYDKRSRQIRR